jgi:energy-coupling factor transporter ATP-binding protein EcfA2
MTMAPGVLATVDAPDVTRPLVRIQGLVKTFPTQVPGRGTVTIRALDGVDLAIAPGEAYGLVGESGSGKTTLARCLLRLTDATAGRIELDAPLRTYLPEAPVGPTIRMALSHLTGLQREPPGEIWESMEPPSREELIAGLEDAELVLRPAEQWHYSNLVFALLGSLILALTLTPVLSSLFLPRQVKEKEPWLVRLAHWVYAPVLSFAEAQRHPHNVARRAYVDIEGVAHPAPAPKFSVTPAEVGSPPAGVGSQTRELLEMAGYDAAGVDALRESGIV